MTNIRRGDLSLLAVLDALLDEQSVTKAAARLSMSQPAVSHALRKLRRMFDDPLFVRSQRGLTSTPKAVALQAQVRQLMLQADELVRRSAFDPARSSALFSIATTDYMQYALLLPLVRALRVEAPGVALRLRSLEIVNLRERMRSGEVDLAVTTPAFAEADFRSRFLYRERYVGVVSRTHPLAKKKAKIDIDAFCSFDHALVSPAGGAASGPVDEALAAVGRKRRIAVTAPNFLILPHLLADSDLVAVAPERLVKGLSSSLKLFAPPVGVPDFDVIAVWHPRVQHDPMHRWLRGRLQTLAEKA